jgi:hypothetical protein
MGESDSYYDPRQGTGNYNYQQQQPNQYQQQYQQQYQYQQPPPLPPQPQQYPPQNQGVANGGYGGESGCDEKHTFEQTFQIEKPKWNDLWAGALVCLPLGCLDDGHCPMLEDDLTNLL